jgi:hypothetical protein
MKGFSKLVRKRFMERLGNTLPWFKRRPMDWPAQCYVYKTSRVLTFYVGLDQFPGNAFDVIVAWSMGSLRPSEIPDTSSPLPDPGSVGQRLPLFLLFSDHHQNWRLDEWIAMTAAELSDEWGLEGNDHVHIAVDAMLEANLELNRYLQEHIDSPTMRWDLKWYDWWRRTHPELYPATLTSEEGVVYPLVDHAVQQIQDYAVPFFQRIAEAHGIPIFSGKT